MYAPNFLTVSSDQTLRIVQELYEKKLVTYPRTDARVLSTAVAKEIYKNIWPSAAPQAGDAATQVLEMGTYKDIAKTRYVNYKQITATIMPLFLQDRGLIA